MAGGRPKKYTDEEVMQKKIDEYFADCRENEEPLTISGLAYALGMTTECLRTYGQSDQFSVTVKRAKQIVERDVEKRLFGANATGSIFWLKNNAGWKDKQDIEHSGGVHLSITQEDSGVL